MAVSLYLLLLFNEINCPVFLKLSKQQHPLQKFCLLPAILCYVSPISHLEI